MRGAPLALALLALAAGSAQAARAPGCTARTASAPSLAVKRDVVAVAGSPFAAVATPDGRHLLVSTTSGTGGAIAVLDRTGSAWKLARTVAVPFPTLGLALARGGRYLLAADQGGVAVLDVRRLLAGSAQPVDSYAPTGSTGSVEVAVSPDGRLAFTSDEYGGTLSVFALRGTPPAPRLLGRVPVPGGPVGLAFSPDGRTLYATSETGRISVVDVALAASSPARAVVASAAAGCRPVRVAVSPGGGTVWVTARGSDALLAFDAKRLRAGAAGALRAVVRVGPAPVGVALVDGGREAVVANSNRFAAFEAPQTLSVVDTAAALAGRPALRGEIPAGVFPRELALLPDGSALVATNYASDGVEVVPTAQLTRLRSASHVGRS